MAQHAYHISKFLGRQHDVAVLLPSAMDVSKYGDEGFRLVPLLSMKHPRLDAWRAARFAKKFRPDVIHVCTAGMAYETLLDKYPVVVRVVGNDFLRPWVGRGLPLRSIVYRLVWGKVKGWFQNIETGLRKSKVIRQLKRADSVVANSDWTQHRLEEEGVGIESIELVVGGMNCELFCPPSDKIAVRESLGIAPQDFVLMTAGNLIGKKGFDTVMRAVAHLKMQGETRLRYIVLGDGPEEVALRQLAKALRIDGEVKFGGRIAQGVLATYYQAGDLYIQISRDHCLPTGSVDVETMGRTYFEAGGCGIPVIGARVGGVPSVIDHGCNGLLVDDPENVEEVAEKICCLMHNTDLRNQMGAEGVRLANEKFSWNHVGTEFERIMSEQITVH